MTATLYENAGGGSQLGTPHTFTNVSAVNGLFTITPDFGNAPCIGTATRYLKLTLTTPNSGPTTLSPRQPLTAAPAALSLVG